MNCKNCKQFLPMDLRKITLNYKSLELIKRSLRTQKREYETELSKCSDRLGITMEWDLIEITAILNLLDTIRETNIYTLKAKKGI